MSSRRRKRSSSFDSSNGRARRSRTPIADTEAQRCDGSYSSPVVVLLVGSRKKALFAHKDILAPVRFFGACLQPNRFAEGYATAGCPLQVTLPEDDPEAMGDVVHYLYTGRLELELKEGVNDSEEIENTMQRLVNLYIAADKYQIEDLCNMIVDAVIRITRRYLTTSNWPEDLRIAGLGDSLLRKYLIQKLAYDIRSCGMDVIEKDGMPIRADLRRYPETGLDVLEELALARIIDPTKFGSCKWHVHTQPGSHEKCLAANAMKGQHHHFFRTPRESLNLI